MSLPGTYFLKAGTYLAKLYSLDEFFNFRPDSVLIHTVSLLQAVQEMVVDGRLNFSLGPSIKGVSIFFQFYDTPLPHVGVSIFTTTYLLAKLADFVSLTPLFLTSFVDNPFLIFDQLCHFASV